MRSVPKFSMFPWGCSLVAMVLTFAYRDAMAQGGNLVGFSSAAEGMPEGLENVIAISAGDLAGAAVLADGEVVTWGGFSPDAVSLFGNESPAVRVSAGGSGSMRLHSDGNLDFFGNPGIVTDEIPAGAVDLVDLSRMPEDGLALKSDGTMIGWGLNYGEEGRMIVPEIDKVVAVAGHTAVGLALLADGTVFQWQFVGLPDPPAGLDDVIAISVAERQAAALRADGSVVTWGVSPGIEPPADLAPLAELEAGEFGFVGRTLDAQFVTWGGSNPSGALGEQDVYGVGVGFHTSSVLLIQKPGMLPFCNVMPKLAKRPEGTDIVLRAHAVGANTYQWKLDGVPIAGATNPWFFIDSVTHSDQGDYTVEIGNQNGSFESEATPVLLDLIDQEITVAPFGDKVFGDPPFEVDAGSSSGLPVRISLSGPAELIEGKIHITGNGTVTILFEQDGDTEYEPAAPVEIRFDTGDVAGPITSISHAPDRLRIEVPWFSTRKIGVEYSPDLTPGSWRQLGNFFEVDGVGVFLEPDPTRIGSASGFYRAFLRPLPE